MQFAHIARVLSQNTNRSLAGSTLNISRQQFESTEAYKLFVQAAQEWGIRVIEGTEKTKEPERLNLGDELPSSTLTDASARIKAAYEGMPVTHALINKLVESSTLAGLRIGVCLIIEPKTAVLALELQRAGALVGIYCPAAETHQEIADELAARGIQIFAHSQWTPQQEEAGALALLDTLKPQLIIDDGASFARLMTMKRSNLLNDFIGVSEETTSGVRAFDAMEADNALDYPVIAVNDSQLKTGFDNVHGTGETCVTTILKELGDDYFEDRTVTVVGFGPVGRGFARRIRALGARVIISEISPVAALKAEYEGFEVQPFLTAVQRSDAVISATGVRHTITIEAMQKMREGTVLAVIGGITNEIALDELTSYENHPGAHQTIIEVPQTHTHLTVLANGDGINYTISGGNPIEIMDMSFAVQINALAHLVTRARSAKPLENRVHRLSDQIDTEIAQIALQARGTAIDTAAGTLSDWKTTRFNDTAKS